MAKRQNSLLMRYILNTSFHGFRYIIEPNRHWTERIFWIACCSVSWWMSGSVITSTWNSFQNNAISFVVETSYTEWDTEFPTVYICETDSEDKIAMVSDRLYGDPHDYNLDEMVKELAFFSGHYFFTLEMCGPDVTEPNKMCYERNFSEIASEVRATCPGLLRKCTWNKIQFDCCKLFIPINTEIGLCYALNSLQTRSKDFPKFEMISNRVFGPGSLTLELNGHNNVYILGSLEVPSVSTSRKDFIEVLPHMHAKRTFSIKDIENQPEVKDLTIHQRKCRFAKENYLEVYPYYSYSACLMQCRKDAQLEKCKCAHHLMPNTSSEKQCSFSGLECFQKNFQELMVQKPPGSKKLGLECDCLPSCTEVQVDVITEHKLVYSEDYSILDLSLERLPTERYKRNVVKGSLDLAVSIGSATAFFLGASFLSVVEFFFYFFVRPISDYLKNKSKKKRAVFFQ